MVKDIKKIKFAPEETVEFTAATQSWANFIHWLRNADEEETIKRCLAFEVQNNCRAQFIDRMRTRYNKLRAYRELKELEAELNMIINVNHV